MKIKINIRLAILIALLATFLIFVGYKYYEWSTLQFVYNLYNKSWSQELGLVQDENKNYLSYLQIYQKIYDKNAPKNALLNNYNELSGDLELVISNQESYKTALQQDSDAYSGINTLLLFGQRGGFVKNIVSQQLNYYQYEKDNAEMTNASLWLTFNLFRVLKDMSIVYNFTYETNSDYQTLIPKFWTDLAPLQAYTDSNFSFEHQDKIKKYYPSAYDLLSRYQSYFSDYYSTMQDAVNGDYQSVSYKIPTLQQTWTSLNVNFNDLYSETKDKTTSNDKNIIQIISDQSNIIKDFLSQKLYTYPLLPSIGKNWKSDLVLCQMYDFKSELYHTITSNYIKASDSASLLNELQLVPPSTQFVDSKFDKGSMKIENNDKQIIFTCIDKTDNTSYKFVDVK